MHFVLKQLDREIAWSDLPEAIVATVVAMFLGTFCGLAVLHTFGLKLSSAHVGPVHTTLSVGAYALDTYSLFLEELKFRAPLILIPLAGFHKRAVVLAALSLSVLFGLIHGNATNILVQGTSGLILSILFLKAGGMHGRFGKAIGASTAAHVAYDNIIYLLAQ